MDIRIGKNSVLERIEDANTIQMDGKSISFGAAKKRVIDRYAEEGIGVAIGSYWGCKEGLSDTIYNLHFRKQLVIFTCVIDYAHPPGN